VNDPEPGVRLPAEALFGKRVLARGSVRARQVQIAESVRF